MWSQKNRGKQTPAVGSVSVNRVPNTVFKLLTPSLQTHKETTATHIDYVFKTVHKVYKTV